MELKEENWCKGPLSEIKNDCERCVKNNKNCPIDPENCVDAYYLEHGHFPIGYFPTTPKGIIKESVKLTSSDKNVHMQAGPDYS